MEDQHLTLADTRTAGGEFSYEWRLRDVDDSYSIAASDRVERSPDEQAPVAQRLRSRLFGWLRRSTRRGVR